MYMFQKSLGGLMNINSVSVVQDWDDYIRQNADLGMRP